LLDSLLQEKFPSLAINTKFSPDKASAAAAVV